MRRFLLLTASLFLLPSFRTNAPLVLPVEPVSPGVLAPAEPSSRDVTLRSPGLKGEPFEASVVFADGSTNACSLYLPAREMTFFFEKDGTRYRNSFPLSTVASLEFLGWKGYCQEDKTTWIFFPERTRVAMHDGRSFECAYYLEEFGKIPAADRVGRTTLYSFFYEYRERGRWRNCGRKEKSWPEAHPPAKVLKRIVFR